MDMIRKDALKALGSVVDPEVRLDILTMGLVYGLDVRPGEISLRLTLTTPGCPMGAMIVAMAQGALEAVAGGRRVAIDLVWTPPWDPRMISAEGRQELDR